MHKHFKSIFLLGLLLCVFWNCTSSKNQIQSSYVTSIDYRVEESNQVADSISQIRSGEVIYKTKVVQSPIDLDEIQKNEPELYGYFANYKKKIERSIDYLEFTLTFNQNESMYKGIETLISDNASVDIMSAERAVRGNGPFYSNLTENIKLKRGKLDGKNYLIMDVFNNVDWEIQNETKEILGYQVYKATSVVPLNHKVNGEAIAWFAPEIPFQFGPINYGNLPGLILEFEIGGYAHYAVDIKLKEKVNKIKRPEKGKIVSALEFDKIVVESVKF